MIPFFRKLRKKMADDNRPVKYMRYAIGEILLVVIGILIALQINNWNESRKLKYLEIQTLKELESSLKTNITFLDDCINGFDIGLKKIEFGLEQIEQNKPYSDSIANSLLALYGYPTMTFDYSAYENLKNRGIDIISNETLKKRVIKMYETNLDYLSVDLKKELHEHTFQTISTFMDNITVDTRDFENMNLIIKDFEKLKSNSKFVNTIFFTLSYKQMGLNYSTRIKENALELMNALDKEIRLLE